MHHLVYIAPCTNPRWSEILATYTWVARLNRDQPVRPPAFDCASPTRSPFAIAAICYSAILSLGGGHRKVVSDLVDGMVSHCGRKGLPNARRSVLDLMRKGALKAAAALHWRHTMRFRSFPFLLARSLDSMEPMETKLSIIRYFSHVVHAASAFRSPSCEQNLLP